MLRKSRTTTKAWFGLVWFERRCHIWIYFMNLLNRACWFQLRTKRHSFPTHTHTHFSTWFKNHLPFPSSLLPRTVFTVWSTCLFHYSSFLLLKYQISFALLSTLLLIFLLFLPSDHSIWFFPSSSSLPSPSLWHTSSSSPLHVLTPEDNLAEKLDPLLWIWKMKCQIFQSCFFLFPEPLCAQKVFWLFSYSQPSRCHTAILLRPSHTSCSSPHLYHHVASLSVDNLEQHGSLHAQRFSGEALNECKWSQTPEKLATTVSQ